MKNKRLLSKRVKEYHEEKRVFLLSKAMSGFQLNVDIKA
jgi:hypothetical protein